MKFSSASLAALFALSATNTFALIAPNQRNHAHTFGRFSVLQSTMLDKQELETSETEKINVENDSYEKPSTSVDGIKMASAKSASELKSVEEKKPKVEAKTTMETVRKEEDNTESSGSSFADRVANSGVASAAAMATAAVNAAVAMKTLEAPDVAKSYISLDKTKELDGEGLPLVYDKDAIQAYWSKEKGALNKRWGYFVGKAVPFLTRLTTLFIKDGKIDEKYIPELSEKARIDLQDLGPTFIKAGQMMSVRPDVLPQVSFSSRSFSERRRRCVLFFMFLFFSLNVKFYIIFGS